MPLDPKSINVDQAEVSVGAHEHVVKLKVSYDDAGLLELPQQVIQLNKLTGHLLHGYLIGLPVSGAAVPIKRHGILNQPHLETCNMIGLP